MVQVNEISEEVDNMQPNVKTCTKVKEKKRQDSSSGPQWQYVALKWKTIHVLGGGPGSGLCGSKGRCLSINQLRQQQGLLYRLAAIVELLLILLSVHWVQSLCSGCSGSHSRAKKSSETYNKTPSCVCKMQPVYKYKQDKTACYHCGYLQYSVCECVCESRQSAAVPPDLIRPQQLICSQPVVPLVLSFVTLPAAHTFTYSSMAV